MNNGTLNRATTDTHVDGRTLVGTAMLWETPAEVSDFGGPKYWEAFARASCDKTLRERPEPRPFFWYHDYATAPGAQPIGVAHFERAESRLRFIAPVARTRKGDECLELARAGAATDVSVGVTAFPSMSRRMHLGNRLVTMRNEVALRELSLATTGFGLYPGARVEQIRAANAGPDATFGDISDAVSDAIRNKVLGTTPPDGVYVYVVAIGDGWAVYCVEGGPDDKPELNDTWRVSYAFDADGVCTIAEPERVEQQWVPIAVEVARAEMGDQSATPRLDAWRRGNGRQ